MIDKKYHNEDIIIYNVTKDYDDTPLSNIMNCKLKRNDIKTIIDHNADVYKEDGKLLLRFRKNILNKDNIQTFYDNIIKFATIPSNNRGSSSGSKKKNVYNNPKIMSNIIGYYDKLSPKQKFLFKQMGKPLPKITVRETRFLQEYPQHFKKTIPLIKEIDTLYKQLVPDKYNKQKKKAIQTPFRIANTSFTTITTNVNFQTTVHTDKGDDLEGFGNLVVIENGNYIGGETCFPQYGIGVDVRNGDIIFMDVHEPHGNLPIQLETSESKRLSIVCYLRKSIWEQTKGKTRKFMEKQNKTMKNIKSKL